MPKGYLNPTKAKITHEDLAQKEKEKGRKERREVDKSKLTPEQLERYEEREKRREERAVRQAKMDEWQGGGAPAEKAPKPDKDDLMHKDGRLFKIYHEKEDFDKTLKDDLKIAAKNS